MNNTYTDTDETESYVYVILILGPILFLYLLQKCLIYTGTFCHRGSFKLDNKIDVV